MCWFVCFFLTKRQRSCEERKEKDLGDVVGDVGLVDHGLEPGLLRREDHRGEVEEDAGTVAGDDEEPWLPAGSVGDVRGCVTREGERGAEEPCEVRRGEAVEAAVLLDDELPVRAEADDGVPEAMHLPTGPRRGKVQRRVAGDRPEELVVLDQPPWRHVCHHELDIAGVLMHRVKERHNDIGEVVEDVPRVTPDRERDGRGVVCLGTQRRRRRSRCRCAHVDLGDAAHARLVALAWVGAHLVRLRARPLADDEDEG